MLYSEVRERVIYLVHLCFTQPASSYTFLPTNSFWSAYVEIDADEMGRRLATIVRECLEASPILFSQTTRKTVFIVWLLHMQCDAMTHVHVCGDIGSEKYKLC